MMRKRTLLVFLVLATMAVAMPGSGETPSPPPKASDARVPRAETPPPRPAGGGATQLFHVVLLVASMDGPEATEGLPQQAEKAIADIRDFLPYKSYRLLDSGLFRAVADSMPSEIVLDGAEGEEYDYRATLRFLAKAGGGKSLLVEQFILYRERGAGARPLGPGFAPPEPKKMIDASFSIDPGETIVVGSSKLKGKGRALVVLLTAMPKS